MSDTVNMIHPDGTRVTLHLPAPAGTAGEVFLAMDEIGFTFEEGKVKGLEVEVEGLDPDRMEEIRKEIVDHIQPLIDAYQVDEKVRKRYREGQDEHEKGTEG